MEHRSSSALRAGRRSGARGLRLATALALATAAAVSLLAPGQSWAQG